MPVAAPPRDRVEMDVRVRQVYVSLTARRPGDVALTRAIGRTVDGRDVFVDLDDDNRILAIGVA